MARYKKSEREEAMGETRRLLLEAAAETFARKGYARANVDAISQAAGFAKGTIYNYFKSKRAVMLALIEDTAGRHLAFIAERVRQEENAELRLALFFEAGFEFVSTHLPQARAIANNLFGPNADFKREMFEAYRPMFDLVGQEIVEPGIGQDRFRPVDPAATTGLVMNLYLGVASQVDETGRPWLQPAEVSDFVLHALRRH